MASFVSNLIPFDEASRLPVMCPAASCAGELGPNSHLYHTHLAPCPTGSSQPALTSSLHKTHINYFWFVNPNFSHLCWCNTLKYTGAFQFLQTSCPWEKTLSLLLLSSTDWWLHLFFLKKKGKKAKHYLKFKSVVQLTEKHEFSKDITKKPKQAAE